jgi:transposase
LLQRYQGLDIFLIYEAGSLGFHLHHSLTDLGIENIIVAPNKIPTVVGDLVKTDRRDAKKLAFPSPKDFLKGFMSPAPPKKGRPIRAEGP